jgi:hypothetical protein
VDDDNGLDSFILRTPVKANFYYLHIMLER